MGPRLLYSVPFFTAAALIFIVAVLAYHRRKARGAWYLTIMGLAASIWAASEGMLYLGFGMEANILVTKLQYLGIAFMPPFALLCGVSLLGFEHVITRAKMLTLVVAAALVISLAWTNPLHKLVFTEYYAIGSGPFPMLGLGHGPLWWTIVYYHYLLVAVLSGVALFRAFSSESLQRAQAAVLLVAVAAAWGLNAVYVSGNSPVPNMDVSPLGFVLVAATLAWGFFRYSLLDILPIARSEIFRGLRDAILVVDEKDRIIDINPAAEAMLGDSASGAIGQDTRRFLGKHPQLLRLLDSTDGDEVHMTTEGQERVFDFHRSVLRDRRGRVLGRVMVLRDTTERKRAESGLRESEKRFRDISYSMADWIWEVDLHGRYTLASGNTEEILGYSPQDLVGKTPFDLMPEEEASRVRGVFERAIAEEKPLVDLENWNLTREGSRVCMLTNGVPIFDEAGVLVGYRGVDRDVTERKRADEERRKLESRLVRSQKMETVGVLAGGVAHDLNNILSGIISYPELLLLDLPEDSPLRQPLMTIQSSGERAAAVVQDMLTLTRRGVAATETVDLNRIIDDQMMSPECERLRAIHPDADFRMALDGSLWNIKGSTAHLSKAVMNLISNAAEAMPHGGTVLISTENRYISGPIGLYGNAEQGDFAVVTVSDTGVGISREDIERVFEPFYTKKMMGRSGSGLGMSVVWGAVEDHSGYIDVESTMGKGTVFTLYFPAVSDELPVHGSRSRMESYMGNGETVLVVDDVAEQREIASRMLSKLGYTVSSVSSGEEALEYLRHHSADLLVLDMIMDPGIDGLETYTQILRLHPAQKAVIASGFTETERVRKAMELGAGQYIGKPYVLEQIGLVVQEELRK